MKHNRTQEDLLIKKTYIRLGRRTSALLYEPALSIQQSRIAILVMHSDEDYLTFPTGVELAQRGHTVLCANVMYKEAILFSQNEKMYCVKEAVDYLRSLGSVDKVILFGHSGGGTLMTAYQAIAENGGNIFRGLEKLYPYDGPDDLPPADGLMLVDSNWGNAVMQVFSLDPAVKRVDNGLDLETDMDLFNPNNGFEVGGSHFSDDFIRKYQKGQSSRNQELLDYATGRLSKIENKQGNFLDDEPMFVAGAAQSFFNNKLYAQDTHLMSHTQAPYKLIHSDGRITNEIIYSVRKPENEYSMTESFWKGGRILSIKNYLSSYAIRTTDEFGYDDSSVWGIDWHSCYSAPPGNVTHITVPLLVMGMTGGWEYLASETIFKMAASKDKDIAFVKGASHKLTPAKVYEDYPGQFGNTLKLVHDYIHDWLVSGRF